MASYPASSYPTPDGVSPTNRVASLTVRKLYTKVVDNSLHSETYAARLFSMGESFLGSTYDIPVRIIDGTAQGQWFTGIETLNMAPIDDTITLSYAQTAFAYPVTSIMVESFANAGPTGIIPLDKYKYEAAVADTVQALGAAVYGNGVASQPDGLGSVVDDGTTVANIGGQSRSTYSNLQGKVTAFSGGVLSLSNLNTLENNVTAAGLVNEEPNLELTDKTTWGLYEQLLTPTVRASYDALNYQAIPLIGEARIVTRPDLKGAAGLTALSYRGKAVLKDDQAGISTNGVWYMLNERYFGWKGRTIVPPLYADVLRKVDMSDFVTYEGVGADEPMPSRSPGWFYQEPIQLPNQPGKVGRIFILGQICSSQPRRQGKGTGISTV